MEKQVNLDKGGVQATSDVHTLSLFVPKFWTTRMTSLAQKLGKWIIASLFSWISGLAGFACSPPMFRLQK